jgi:hypothetical protein
MNKIREKKNVLARGIEPVTSQMSIFRSTSPAKFGGTLKCCLYSFVLGIK